MRAGYIDLLLKLATYSMIKTCTCRLTIYVPWCVFQANVNCHDVVGYLAVYRVQFAVACFFLLFMLLMIGVKSSKDGRAGIQNGFWGIKFLLVIGGTVGAFFIPSAGRFSEGKQISTVKAMSNQPPILEVPVS